jgi:hypothetical protein
MSEISGQYPIHLVANSGLLVIGKVKATVPGGRFAYHHNAQYIGEDAGL